MMDWVFRSPDGFTRYIEFEKEQNRKKMIEIAAAEAKERRKTVDGLGQVVSQMPVNIYMRWDREFPGCWKDKDFRRRMLNDNPELRAVKPEARHFSFAR